MSVLFGGTGLIMSELCLCSEFPPEPEMVYSSLRTNLSPSHQSTQWCLPAGLELDHIHFKNISYLLISRCFILFKVLLYCTCSSISDFWLITLWLFITFCLPYVDDFHHIHYFMCWMLQQQWSGFSAGSINAGFISCFSYFGLWVLHSCDGKCDFFRFGRG